MTVRKSQRGWLLAVGTAAAFALIFMVFGGFSVGYTMKTLAWLGSAGFIIGAIGAPELAPELFRFPVLWQVSFSVSGCVLVAAYLEAGSGGFALAGALGLVLGFLAPYWIKHMQVP